MSRKRVGFIRESLEELVQLEEAYRGKPEALRIAALRMILQEPGRSIDDVAALVSYSSSAVKRWLRSYKNGGIGALLERRAGGRDAELIDEGLAKLKQRLVSGEFDDLEEVHSWIDDYRRSSGAQRLARQAVRGRRRNVGRAADGLPSSNGHAGHDAGSIAERMLDFLAHLPLTLGADEWIRELQRLLQELLVDVDRATVGANMLCTLRPATVDSKTMFLVQDVGPAGNAIAQDAGIEWSASGPDSSAQGLSINASVVDGQSAESIKLTLALTHMKNTGFPMAEFRAPKGFVYFFNDVAYVGMIILWRSRRKPEISDATLETMERLRPLFRFILSDFVARHQAAWPVQRAVDDAVTQIATDAQLTRQEKRTLLLQLLGCSYDEVAEVLNISINTVRTHVKAIYTKTGAHSPLDFVARYFTPQAASMYETRIQAGDSASRRQR